ncbi:MAG: T9SS type A sorting domain-containing protein [Ignavibacteriaceae bacterium]
MKKLTIFMVFLLFNAALFAQTYFDVPPGAGTLNDAITAHQGNVIYRLQAGQWYILNGIIQNTGFTLTIVGTTPTAGEMPAVIQTATKADGTVIDRMFDVLGDLTIRNVFFVNANQFDTRGDYIFNVQSTTTNRIILDSVTCDPVGNGSLMGYGNTPNPKLYITNSLFLRMGFMESANDGTFIHMTYGGPSSNAFDTLYVENNTFMCTGTFFYNGTNFTADSEKFIWFNHNSFIFHKSQLMFAGGQRAMNNFVTNNLFFDFDTQPINNTWGLPGITGKWSGVNADTTSADTVNGQLLSPRKLFVEYNSWYLDPRIQAYVTTWAATHTVNNDGITPIPPAYFMELGYPKDSARVNQVAGMYNTPQFPYFKFGNYWSNSMNPKSITDPQWTDSKFYTIEDSLYLWTLPAAELNTWGFSAASVNPQPSQIGNWFWLPDTNYGNPVTWPRVNASYKNSTMLTASIEGLPLGDLNWFPAAKAIWQKNQATVMAHILNENTSVINITSVKQENNQTPTNFALSQNYPNPFNPSTEIKYSIAKSGIVTLKVYNLLGQEVATLVNQEQKSGNYVVNFDASKLASGVYMYRIQAGDFSLTKKMTLLK